jgi:hypothetical protein
VVHTGWKIQEVLRVQIQNKGEVAAASKMMQEKKQKDRWEFLYFGLREDQ